MTLFGSVGSARMEVPGWRLSAKLKSWLSSTWLNEWMDIGWDFSRFNVFLDSKVHEANMGPIWGRQDPDGAPCWSHELCNLGCHPYIKLCHLFACALMNCWIASSLLASDAIWVIYHMHVLDTLAMSTYLGHLSELFMAISEKIVREYHVIFNERKRFCMRIGGNGTAPRIFFTMNSESMLYKIKYDI